MNIYWQSVIFLISLLLFLLFIFINYKLGQRRGLKKSLYLVTYRCVCVIFAFIIAPYFNEYILNYDLYESGKAIRYNGMHFYRLIDFFEEVIVHNEVLNDIYNLFPSLKNLLMDFPQVIFIPFSYVIVFIFISLFLLPLYLFLSYKRKRRILYEVEYKKAPRIWAGIISAIQSVVLITIILTPINGLSRIYKEASKDLIEDESNICLQNDFLKKYNVACQIIEGYNASVIGIIDDNIVGRYVYSSLTRINYEDRETSLNNEVVTLARAGIILNKTGLLTAINISDFDDVRSLNFNSLTLEDIEIIIKAFEDSLYTREVVYEVYEWSKAYLGWLIMDLISEDIPLEYTYEELINEIRIILTTINYILNNETLLKSITDVYKIIEEFVNTNKNDLIFRPIEKLFFDVVYAVDFDSLIVVFNHLKDTKIYHDFVPRMLEYFLRLIDIEVEFEDVNDLNRIAMYALGIGKRISNHRYIYNVFHLLNDLTNEDIAYLSEFLDYIVNDEDMIDLAYALISFGVGEAQLKLDIPVTILYEIKDWKKEFELVHLIINIVYKAMYTGVIDYDLAWYGLTTYDDNVAFKAAIKMGIEMLPDVFVMWLAGKDYKYLVGEYVEEKVY